MPRVGGDEMNQPDERKDESDVNKKVLSSFRERKESETIERYDRGSGAPGRARRGGGGDSGYRRPRITSERIRRLAGISRSAEATAVAGFPSRTGALVGGPPITPR